MGSISRWSSGPAATPKYTNNQTLPHEAQARSTGNQIPRGIGTASSTAAVLLSTAWETGHTGRCLLCLPEISISTTPSTIQIPVSYKAVAQKGEMYFCLLSRCSLVAQSLAGNGSERQCNKYKNRIGLLELFYIKKSRTNYLKNYLYTIAIFLLTQSYWSTKDDIQNHACLIWLWFYWDPWGMWHPWTAKHDRQHSVCVYIYVYITCTVHILLATHLQFTHTYQLLALILWEFFWGEGRSLKLSSFAESYGITSRNPTLQHLG